MEGRAPDLVDVAADREPVGEVAVTALISVVSPIAPKGERDVGRRRGAVDALGVSRAGNGGERDETHRECNPFHLAIVAGETSRVCHARVPEAGHFALARLAVLVPD